MIISQTSGVPIYQQISESFRTDILEGRLKEGEYLPSIRGLAKDLRISVITTIKAYEMLESEGLVTAVQGKGYMVNAQDGNMLKEQHLRKVEEGLMQAISSARIAGMSEEELMDTFKILLSLRDEPS
ncbi:MAG: GntR family transcriptional regulator [Lachnospiraceae bacterium]|nr:GntR family transcriptional regulator [Lachnospiraceae bacterium]MCR4946257.1 GntR family transcriptional regulator [Lachnospiraceae bacterium]